MAAEEEPIPYRRAVTRWAALTFVVALVALAAALFWRSEGGSSPALAASGGPEMVLNIKGGDCDDAIRPTECDVPLGAQFTLSVNALGLPPGGYIAFQTFIFYGIYHPEASEDAAGPDTCSDGLDNSDPERDGGGDGTDRIDSDCVVVALTYKPNPPEAGSTTNEIVWPDAQVTLRSSPMSINEYLPGASEDGAGPGTCSDGINNDPNSVGTDERDSDCKQNFPIPWAAVHVGLTSLTPPLPFSHYEGNIVELEFTCSASLSSSLISLLPVGDPITTNSGSAYFINESDIVPAKVGNLTVNCVDAAPAAVGGVALAGELRGSSAQHRNAPWLWAALGFGGIAALSALALARRRRAVSG
ncbi:MAG: hypothetical protein J4O04_02660 [Chloroflexi bacterium]|nr:hypothetical protein [Chloroflexota bacterium]